MVIWLSVEVSTDLVFYEHCSVILYYFWLRVGTPWKGNLSLSSFLWWIGFLGGVNSWKSKSFPVLYFRVTIYEYIIYFAQLEFWLENCVFQCIFFQVHHESIGYNKISQFNYWMVFLGIYRVEPIQLESSYRIENFQADFGIKPFLRRKNQAKRFFRFFFE